MAQNTLTYFDFESETIKRRVFSKLETDQINNVFSTIENILSENKLTMKDKWISIGKCSECKTCENLYFFMEVDTVSNLSGRFTQNRRSIRRIQSQISQSNRTRIVYSACCDSRTGRGMTYRVKECDRCKTLVPEENLDHWPDFDYRETGCETIELYLCRRCSVWLSSIEKQL